MDEAAKAYCAEVAAAVYNEALEYERRGDFDMSTLILTSIDEWLIETLELVIHPAIQRNATR